MVEFDKIKQHFPVSNFEIVSRYLFFENRDDVFVSDKYGLESICKDTKLSANEVKFQLKKLSQAGILLQIHSNRWAKNPNYFNVSEHYYNSYGSLTEYQK